MFTKKNLQISLSVLSIVGYGIFAFAAPNFLTTPSGGYTPGTELDPVCAPNSFDCIVKPGILTASNGLTATGTDVKLGGTLTRNTTVEQDGFDYSINDTTTGINWMMTKNNSLTGGISAGFAYVSPVGKQYINGILQFGDDFHNYQGVLDFSPGGQGETALEVGYFHSLPIYGGAGRQAIFLKGGANSSGSDSTEMFITTNDVFIRAQGNTSSDIILRGLAFQGGAPMNDLEVFKFTGDGSAKFNYYASSRDDTAAFTPANFLYTDTTGKILSAPITSVGGGGSGWGLTGNAGTTAGTNFIGTTDAQDFVMKVGGTEKAHFYQNSSVSFGGGVALSDFMVVSGFNAGTGSTNARASNWLGINAGSGATNASFSNFLGGNVGVNATNAAYSNFLGSAAGYGANEASNSNFLGADSGNDASNAAYSNFLGSASGRSAVNAYQSFFAGQNAGRSNQLSTGSVNSSNSIFIGRNANYTADGFNLNNTVTNTTDGCNTNNCYSILLGNYTNTAGFSNSIALGAYATNTASNQFMIGSSTRPIDQFVMIGTGGTSCAINANGTACSSDQRLKKNIVDLNTNVLESLTKVKSVNFNWTNGTDTSNHIGFIAQDIQQYYPELVSTSSNGFLTVNYAGMTPILVEAVRELDLKLENIQNFAIATNKTFMNNLVVWFADRANGIGDLFADRGHFKDSVCVGNTCVTEAQLQQLLQQQGQSGVQPAVVIPPILTPESTIEPEPIIDPVIEVDPVIIPVQDILEPETPPQESLIE